MPRIVRLFSLYGKEMAKPIHLAVRPPTEQTHREASCRY
ncbi:hypothetical protein SS05631_c30990 [Sinorhizobium sp. CCBAU 05631]|nr:hypothetical protein SS05631_c30990 [Sinorhizobium sp. CCBAU 05631]